MPEESKKNQQKGKNEPKDQRRRRQGRHPAGPVEKKPEKQPEGQVEKQSKEPEKPAYKPPGPEFYKNLKRETDDILKITEEANSKYKKKEIQSNWAKYEMPVDSYEEIDEQENMGADYEKLIQAPAIVGGHFQFKHEKSWDADMVPSLYDKYFDINMDHLSLAISTIPFFERNSIEQSIFNETDIVTMNHRATKFKHKYYNDKKYNTPELEVQEKILKSLSTNNDDTETINDDKTKDACKIDDNSLISLSVTENSNTTIDKDIVQKERVNEKEKLISNNSPVNENTIQVTNVVEELKLNPDANITIVTNTTIDDTEVLFGDEDEISEKEEGNKKSDIMFTEGESTKDTKVNSEIKSTENTQKTPTKDTPKNPVIESPEDLEKWLDDFLDG